MPVRLLNRIAPPRGTRIAARTDAAIRDAGQHATARNVHGPCRWSPRPPPQRHPRKNPPLLHPWRDLRPRRCPKVTNEKNYIILRRYQKLRVT
jgi:hypothetical protein